jgi:hypothetical protein
MRIQAVFLVACIVAPWQAASAEDLSPKAVLQQDMQAKLPPNWQVHVSERESHLLVLLMPPFNQAFDLWYAPDQQQETVRDLCPGLDERIWDVLAPDHDVVLQPTVGGKTVPGMQFSCRKALAESAG